MAVRLSYVLAGAATLVVVAAAVPALSAAHHILSAPPPATGHRSPTPSPGTLVAPWAGAAATLPTPGAPLCGARLAPVDLGRAPTEPARATALDDRGRVGGVVNLWSPPSYQEKPVVWSGGSSTVLDRSPGSRYGQVVALNNRGEALGVGRHVSNGQNSLVLWDAKGSAHVLSAWNVEGRAYDLNDQGQALASLDGKYGVWSAGRFTQIPPPPGGRYLSEATDLNEHGQAIGRSDAPNSQGTIEAWVWDGKRRWDLTSPYGGDYDQTIAAAQNDQGVVVGYSSTTRGVEELSTGWFWRRGLLYPLVGFIPADIDSQGRILGVFGSGPTRQVAIWQPGGAMTMLGTFGAGPGGRLQPLALNDHGQALVFANRGGNTDGRLWLSEGGHATELPVPARFRYVSGFGTLNERGDVIGSGVLANYQEHSILWGRSCYE